MNKHTTQQGLKYIASGVILSALILAVTSEAQVMQSANYQLQSDSINAGGSFSSSTNYVLEDTVGEIATGLSTSTTYALKAGYQQMQEVYLAMTAAANVTMTPSIPGVTGGTATGSTNVIVTTDSPSGYYLTIRAEGDPALQSPGDSFANYTTAGAIPDFAFGINPEDSEFAFTPEGVDITQRFQDSVGACNALGGDTADACWDALGTSPLSISQNTSSNHPTGATTTIKFRAESGANHVQSPGTYTATTTLTALPL